MASRFRLLVGFALLISALALGLAACGATTSSGMSGMPGLSHGGATSTGPAATGAAGETVNVTLSDFKVASSRTTFTAGTIYHFIVTNKGQTNHELMVMAPMNGDGMSMDDMDKVSLYHIGQSDLPPGASKSFDLTFSQPAAAGQIEFACHVGSHYKVGMHEPISVVRM